jgi:hypothetical protein
MKGERKTPDGRFFRCRAITNSGDQCKRRCAGSIAAINLCRIHRAQVMCRKPLQFVEVYDA